jgi:hypothetical protein
LELNILHSVSRQAALEGCCLFAGLSGWLAGGWRAGTGIEIRALFGRFAVILGELQQARSAFGRTGQFGLLQAKALKREHLVGAVVTFHFDEAPRALARQATALLGEGVVTKLQYR